MSTYYYCHIHCPHQLINHILTGTGNVMVIHSIINYIRLDTTRRDISKSYLRLHKTIRIGHEKTAANAKQEIELTRISSISIINKKMAKKEYTKTHR